MKCFASLLVSAGLTSCVVTANVQDPTVTLNTAGGQELGVSTPLGVVFLGRTAHSGEVDLTVWYGDGPSIEPSIIEPLGDGLYLAQGEILMPFANVAFIQPGPDDELFARGRQGADVWEIELFAVDDPRLTGLAFRSADPLPTEPNQAGAGVFWSDPDTDQDYLIGLISGTVQFGTDGPKYVTAIGGEGLWRLVAHRQASSDEGRFVYRDDIL